MRRLLLVAYYFPPIAGIGSIRLGSLARDLPEFGWDVTVLAPRRTPHPVDHSLAALQERVVRSLSLEPALLARALRRSRRTSARGETGRPAVASAARTFLYPDPQIGWYPGAAVAGTRLLRRRDFDAIYSSSFPITAHLVAAALSRRSRLPWVAEFRDPWSDLLPAGHPHRRRAQALEHKIAGGASRVVMPTPAWAARYSQRWGTDIAVAMNGSDPVAMPAPTPAAPVLAHLGSFYPGRQTLAGLWDALGRLDRGGGAVPSVRFIGELSPAIRAEAEAAGVGDRIEVTGLVSHAEAVRLTAGASILFASGGRTGDVIERGWIPAKLFEYLATSLPVLYLGDAAGDAAKLLASQPGCHVVDPLDVETIASVVESAAAGRRYERDIERFTRRACARRVAAVLDGVVERRR